MFHAVDQKQQPATDAEVQELSALLNIAQKRVIPRHQTQSWFKLFRHIDSDRSGVISYGEFVEMVRKLLKLSAQKLPNARLQAVWRKLDTSGDGLLQSGEVSLPPLSLPASPLVPQLVP